MEQPTITAHPLQDHPPATRERLRTYVLHLADTHLVLAHRLSELCGHGPVLEQDMAMTNIALDLLGTARNLFQYAAELEGKGRTEDDLAYLRGVTAYLNPLLVERPNGDFAHTVVRQFLFDTWHVPLLEALRDSGDHRLSAIATQSLKEANYHIQWSGEWMVRLGDSTEEARRRVEAALTELWPYTGELFTMTEGEQALHAEGLIPDNGGLKAAASAHLERVFSAATLPVPADGYWHKGGKQGRHTEHLGYLLAELQYLQRTYPGQQW
jgi:ring-1,2-phenylacetyl-CoA epoxidase subunit PaaC